MENEKEKTSKIRELRTIRDELNKEMKAIHRRRHKMTHTNYTERMKSICRKIPRKHSFGGFKKCYILRPKKKLNYFQSCWANTLKAKIRRNFLIKILIS